jgi:hypothetical protein
MSVTEGSHVKTRPDFAAWLTEHATKLADINPRPDDELETRVDKSLALLGRLHAEGLAGWGWPEDLGGLGGDATDRAALYDALTLAGFGMPEQVGALEVLGSALTAFAPDLARYRPSSRAASSGARDSRSPKPEATSPAFARRRSRRPVAGSSTGRRCGLRSVTGPAGAARWHALGIRPVATAR